MYLRITCALEGFDLSDFPGVTHVEALAHAGVVNVYRPCYEFAWERDGEWWVSFDGGNSKITSPLWDEWGLVSEVPVGAIEESR